MCFNQEQTYEMDLWVQVRVELISELPPSGRTCATFAHPPQIAAIAHPLTRRSSIKVSGIYLPYFVGIMCLFQPLLALFFVLSRDIIKKTTKFTAHTNLDKSLSRFPRTHFRKVFFSLYSFLSIRFFSSFFIFCVAFQRPRTLGNRAYEH